MKSIERKLHKINATDQSIGRLSTRIATLLRGKNKPEYIPHIDGGDIVEVSNIDKAKFTGKKLEQKEYYSYSGYPGGLKTKKISEIKERNAGEILVRSVKQMLPATKLRNNMLKRLIVR